MLSYSVTFFVWGFLLRSVTFFVWGTFCVLFFGCSVPFCLSVLPYLKTSTKVVFFCEIYKSFCRPNYPNSGLRYPDYLFYGLSLASFRKTFYLCPTKKIIYAMRRLFFLSLSVLWTLTIFSQIHDTLTMTPQQQCFVRLAANEAVGNIEALRPAIHQAFDQGFTVMQVKEVFAHLYAYTGFPRSLNAQNALAQVLSERAQEGRTPVEGQDATPLPADYNALTQGTAVQTELCGGAHQYNFCPAEDYFLKAHLFGDIFARDVLTYAERELVTVSALAAMSGTEPQLASHKQIAVRAGNPVEIVEEAALLAHHIGTYAVITTRENNVSKTIIPNRENNVSKTVITNRENLPFPEGLPNQLYQKYFTGQSYLVTLKEDDPTLSNVTFEPGCRNHWHIHHDVQQVLICVAGEGLYQEWGKPAQLLQPGAVITIPAGVKHWHGATCDSWFQHVVLHVPAPTPAPSSIHGNEWLEPVSDSQYLSAHSARL